MSLNIEPLEQVIDHLRNQMRNAHIVRLKEGACSIETGFVWLDLITGLERTAAHCSNIAVCLMDASENTMSLHKSLSVMNRESPYYKRQYERYSKKYVIGETT